MQGEGSGHQGADPNECLQLINAGDHIHILQIYFSFKLSTKNNNALMLNTVTGRATNVIKFVSTNSAIFV